MNYSRRENESKLDYHKRIIYGKLEDKTLNDIDYVELSKEAYGKEYSSDVARRMFYGSRNTLELLDEEKTFGFDKSIMIMGDIHLPYEREDVLENISKHANEIDTLVIGGDLLDCESISSFPQIKNLTLEHEIVYAHDFIKKIRKILNKNQKIILVRGNHEERMSRNICKMHEKDLQKFINPEVLEMLVDGFTIYDNGKKKKYEGIENTIYVPHWFVNLDNKIIVCHPKDFSKVKGKMLENTVQHFVNRNEEFDAVVILHTHKISSGLIDRFQGKFAIECGCNCKPQQYSDVGKLGYSPQAYGYVIIKYNEHDKVNPNNIKQYYLEEELNDDDISFSVKL